MMSDYAKELLIVCPSLEHVQVMNDYASALMIVFGLKPECF